MTDFKMCMKKMEAFQQFLIYDQPHPAWTNFLSIDDILVISQERKAYLTVCLNRIYCRVLESGIKPMLTKSLMYNYGNIKENLREEHLKIRRKAILMGTHMMAEAFDSSGNSIDFPVNMSDNDKRGLLIEIEGIRTNFNRLREAKKPVVWNTIKGMAMAFDAKTDHFPNPIGNSENSFEALLVSTLALNEDHRNRLLASVNDFVSNLLVVN